MSASKRTGARDDQVFLMMGVNEEEEDAQCAIVMANDTAEAKKAFSRAFKGSVLMTWPSLREIKLSVAMMDLARNGGVPEDVVVINQME